MDQFLFIEIKVLLKRRLLLTDQNGLYHKFIKEMISKTECNSLIILIMQEDDLNSHFINEDNHMMSLYEKYLYDPDLVRKLADSGKQPSVEVLAKNLMVVLLDYGNKRK